jgi:hypothetical protein
MDNLRDQKDSTNSIVSAARRRALKVGLAAVPTMLTLRSKPVFGTDSCGPSMSLSAANSHHVLDVLPGCNSNSFK